MICAACLRLMATLAAHAQGRMEYSQESTKGVLGGVSVTGSGTKHATLNPSRTCPTSYNAACSMMHWRAADVLDQRRPPLDLVRD
jgi:hypothetical protein